MNTSFQVEIPPEDLAVEEEEEEYDDDLIPKSKKQS